jgi:hypothetical protein
MFSVQHIYSSNVFQNVILMYILPVMCFFFILFLRSIALRNISITAIVFIHYWRRHLMFMLHVYTYNTSSQNVVFLLLIVSMMFFCDTVNTYFVIWCLKTWVDLANKPIHLKIAHKTYVLLYASNSIPSSYFFYY